MHLSCWKLATSRSHDERKKESKVWLHFRKKDDNSGSCKVCKMIISCWGENTSNMLKPFSLQHVLKLQGCQVFDTLRATSTQQISTSVTKGKYPML